MASASSMPQWGVAFTATADLGSDAAAAHSVKLQLLRDAAPELPRIAHKLATSWTADMDAALVELAHVCATRPAVMGLPPSVSRYEAASLPLHAVVLGTHAADLRFAALAAVPLVELQLRFAVLVQLNRSLSEAV